MKIALDYDETYTADPSLWDQFVKAAMENNHTVRIVTYRSAAADNKKLIETANNLGVNVMYTEGKAKRRYCINKGWEPDIWIDDKPELIVSGTASICSL